MREEEREETEMEGDKREGRRKGHGREERERQVKQFVCLCVIQMLHYMEVS